MFWKLILFDLQAVVKWYCTPSKESKYSCFEDGEFNYLKSGTFLIIT